MNDIQIATLSDIEKMVPLLLELRPHRTEEEIRQQYPVLHEQGYRIIYIGDETVYSILGFRIVTSFFSGKTLIVDDLCTASSAKNQGLAGRLFSWIKKHAEQTRCEHISLNSGFHRNDAHRFYLNHGLRVESLHFGCKLG